MTAPAIQPVALPDGRVRVVIEHVTPSVDGGRFAAKRVVGDAVTVEADCFADGHDKVACAVQWRHGDGEWRSSLMQPLGNDRWRATFDVDRVGHWQYAVRAWVDPFLSWRHDFERRVDLDDLRVAARGGAALIAQAAQRARRPADARALEAWAQELLEAVGSGADADAEALKAIALDPVRAALAERHPDLRHALTSAPLPLTVERLRARFSSWYEFFPRSAAKDPKQHGTFADCEAWLPYVQKLGFDVLYFPPIHPIGRERRKGRNNTLDPEPHDVGSPWAIGAGAGGHDAILGELGTLQDFKRLVGKAAEHGIEIALDIAFQCAPDHPWVREHPEWFRQRADGSIQYAENPPKKYQDIYPFDFETPHWRELWQALAGVIEFWVAQGVRIFRVDNPHTKAFGFWEYAIARVRAATPEVIFLSEAFTRPKVMHRLAKLGFSQSYTYYTWRNTKHELTQYFTELAHGPGRDYFRPNVWPNTPDILPVSLQQGGRAAFMVRATLAATLAANYGIYGPAFELQESTPIRPGAEEYLHSEKYERRVWDLARDDSLADFIAVLNRARRDNPALHSDEGLRFLRIENEQMIAYAKATPDRSNIVVCIVNLDVRHAQSGWVELDLPSLGLEPQQAYQMRDLISDAHYLWNGPRNFVQLDPQRAPVHVLQLRAQRHREHDFDYFL